MFDCVIPAAGASSRMRGPAGPADIEGCAILKPLLPFGPRTLVETAVRAALEAGCRVLLVIGNRAPEVAAPFMAGGYAAELGEGRLLLIENPLWEEGLLGSIQSALPRVAGEAFFIAHADMPFIRPADYLSLAAALPAAPAALFASQGGRRGHPVLLPAAWIPEILSLGRGGQLKDFLARRPGMLIETGAGALRDIDTPEDYELLRS